MRSAQSDSGSSVSSRSRTSANSSKGGAPTSLISSPQGKKSACTFAVRFILLSACLSDLDHLLGSRGPPSATSIAPTATSRAQSHAPSTVGSRAYTTRGAAPPPVRPPGLPHPSSATAQLQFGEYERFNWGDDAEELEVNVDDEPTTPSVASVSLDPDSSRFEAPRPSRRVPEPQGAIDPYQDYDYDEDDVPKRSMADAMKDVFGVAPKPVQVTRQAPPVNGEGVGRAENLWKGYAVARKDAPTKVNIKAGGERWECPQHGPLCNPGICNARYSVECERRFAEERAEREEETRKRKERWKRKERKEARKKRAEEGGLEDSLDGSSDRGSGSRSNGSSSSSTNGDSDSDGSSGTEGDAPRIRRELLIVAERGWLISDLIKLATALQSPDLSNSEANTVPGNFSEDDNWLWGDEDDKSPKVNITRNAWPTTNTDPDEVDETRSVASTGTSSTPFTSSNSSQSRGGDSSPQLPWKSRGPPISRASNRGNKPASPKSPTLGQPSTNVPSVINDILGDASSFAQLPPLELRQPEWDARSERSSPLDRLLPSLQGRSAPSVSSIAESSSEIVVPDGGFPTYADEKWADPIAAAQPSRTRTRNRRTKRSSTRTNSGTEKTGDDSESEKAEEGEEEEEEQGKQDDGQSAAGSGKTNHSGGRGRGRGSRSGSGSVTGRALQVALPSVLDVELAPAAPGKWGDPDVEW